jgi:hypothetical protein
VLGATRRGLAIGKDQATSGYSRGPERRILSDVLSNEVVAEHLMRHYGIDGGISRIPRGRAENYRVVCRGEHWEILQPATSCSVKGLLWA